MAGLSVPRISVPHLDIGLAGSAGNEALAAQERAMRSVGAVVSGAIDAGRILYSSAESNAQVSMKNEVTNLGEEYRNRVGTAMANGDWKLGATAPTPAGSAVEAEKTGTPQGQTTTDGLIKIGGGVDEWANQIRDQLTQRYSAFPKVQAQALNLFDEQVKSAHDGAVLDAQKQLAASHLDQAKQLALGAVSKSIESGNPEFYRTAIENIDGLSPAQKTEMTVQANQSYAVGRPLYQAKELFRTQGIGAADNFLSSQLADPTEQKTAMGLLHVYSSDMMQAAKATISQIEESGQAQGLTGAQIASKISEQVSAGNLPVDAAQPAIDRMQASDAVKMALKLDASGGSGQSWLAAQPMPEAVRKSADVMYKAGYEALKAKWTNDNNSAFGDLVQSVYAPGADLQKLQAQWAATSLGGPDSSAVRLRGYKLLKEQEKAASGGSTTVPDTPTVNLLREANASPNMTNVQKTALNNKALDSGKIDGKTYDHLEGIRKNSSPGLYQQLSSIRSEWAKKDPVTGAVGLTPEQVNEGQQMMVDAYSRDPTMSTLEIQKTAQGIHDFLSQSRMTQAAAKLFQYQGWFSGTKDYPGLEKEAEQEIASGELGAIRTEPQVAQVLKGLAGAQGKELEAKGVKIAQVGELANGQPLFIAQDGTQYTKQKQPDGSFAWQKRNGGAEAWAMVSKR